MALDNRYSALDRLLHRLAFSTHRAQIDMAGLEKRLCGDDFEAMDAERPVFICALPRASTTLLLDLLAQSGRFATQCYRDMPFVLLPVLWDRFSRRFRTDDVPRERAHGDGMLVGLDSPEAFEEIVWMAFWPGHYAGDRIIPWDCSDKPEFLEAYVAHIRKIAWLRHLEAGQQMRYVSKNNANIARITWLARAFPGAIFLVPYREAAQQAASLLEVHRKFTAIHDADAFARRYMADIGHFDFGRNLRPVDFDGWLDAARHRDPMAIGFWIEYWTRCYRHLLGLAGERLYFVSYEGLCADPHGGLARVAKAVGLAPADGLAALAGRIHAARPRNVDVTSVAPAVLEESTVIHEQLELRSLI